MLRTILFLVIAVCVLPTQDARAGYSLPFKGLADFEQNLISLKFFPQKNVSPFDIKISREAPGFFKWNVALDHFRLSGTDVSSQLLGEARIVYGPKAEPRIVKLKVWSEYSLINYKPVQELAGQFTLKDGFLDIDQLIIGPVATQGRVQLVPPYRVDLNWSLTGVRMSDFISFFAGPVDFKSEGLVDGVIKAHGTAGNVNVSGKFTSVDGFIKELLFHHINLNIEGIYPLIHVTDSTITKADGTPFQVSGMLNLDDQETFKDQIQALTIMAVVSQDRQNSEWTLKRLESQQTEGVTEFKYIHRNEGGQTDDSDMLGVQREMKF